MPRIIVSAPSRLHFGLWSLGGAGRRQFGGVGAMIDKPALRISVEDADEFVAVGAGAGRAAKFAQRWADFLGLPTPKCRIEIAEAIPEHAGLGSGTQLALSVAAGLSHFTGLSAQSPLELAQRVGRGLRSAVGTYGFAYGGLIIEQGKQPPETISPLDCRIDLPEAWRWVLARPLDLTGLAGADEASAFESLPPVSPGITEELMALARDALAPAAASDDFDAFAASLYRYGRLSGECFAARQGGPYNGPVITALIERIRERGYFAVGQSSWGPTVFVATPAQTAAEELAQWLADSAEAPLDVLIARPDNRGAVVEIEPSVEVN